MNDKAIIVIAPYRLGRSEEIYQLLWNKFSEGKLPQSKAFFLEVKKSKKEKEKEKEDRQLAEKTGAITIKNDTIMINDTQVFYLYIPIGENLHFLWIQEQTGLPNLNFSYLCMAINWLLKQIEKGTQFYVAYHDKTGLRDRIFNLHNTFTEIHIDHIEFVHEDSDFIYPTLKSLIKEICHV